MTWSVVARDPDTEQLGVAVASFAQSAGKFVPSIAKGIGAIATQAKPKPTSGADSLNLLRRGMTPKQVVSSLTAEDSGRRHRQIHMIDADGKQASFTGEAGPGWAGHEQDRNVSVAGNTLAGPEVVSAALKAYKTAERNGETLTNRLMQALDAGAAAGGDRRGLRSAAIVATGDKNHPPIEIHVDHSDHPLREVRSLLSSKRGNKMQSFIFNQPRNAEERRKQALIASITGSGAPSPVSAGQGAAQGLGSVLSGFALRNMKRGDFPKAPGGAKPSFGTGLMNFLGISRGGLY